MQVIMCWNKALNKESQNMLDNLQLIPGEAFTAWNVILSKAGRELMSVITDKRKIDGFAEFVSGVIVKDMGGILEDIFKISEWKKDISKTLTTMKGI